MNIDLECLRKAVKGVKHINTTLISTDKLNTDDITRLKTKGYIHEFLPKKYGLTTKGKTYLLNNK